MRWTETMTYIFVKLYSKSPCLWNPLDINYKVQKERELAYEKMAKDFHEKTKKYLSTHEVKNKIKALRTTYLQQVKKIWERSTPTYTYMPTIAWFEAMDNILKNTTSSKHIDPQLMPNNIQEKPSQTPCVTQGWVDSNSDNELNPATEPLPDPLTNTDEGEDITIKEESSSPEENNVAPKKKMIKLQKNKRRTFKNSSKSKVAKNPPIDEFDIYGKYIASQLRKMELTKALKMQLAIQNLVSEARLSDLPSFSK